MDDNYDSCQYVLQTGTLTGVQCGKPIKIGSKYCDACFTHDNLQKRYPDNKSGIFFVPIYGYDSANNVCGFVIRDGRKIAVSCLGKHNLCSACLVRSQYLRSQTPTPTSPSQEGDKFAPRNAQMCTIGSILSNTDLPHMEAGLVPDLVINPNAIQPSQKRNRRNRNKLSKK